MIRMLKGSRKQSFHCTVSLATHHIVHCGVTRHVRCLICCLQVSASFQYSIPYSIHPECSEQATCKHPRLEGRASYSSHVLERSQPENSFLHFLLLPFTFLTSRFDTTGGEMEGHTFAKSHAVATIAPHLLTKCISLKTHTS